MKVLTRSRLMLFLVFLLIQFSAIAQTEEEQQDFTGGFLNAKLGFGNFWGDDSMFGGSLELGLIKNKHMFVVGITNQEEILGPIEITTADLYYGSYKGNKYVRFAYQAGLGAVWGTKEYDADEFVTIGVPAKIELSFMPIKYLSLAVDLHANLNPKHSFIMPAFRIGIGLYR